ncbi:hypothetical protein Btru_025254 [Bulinus truncatus]|nr:hypothetical protein Btru_025254 [Bulinus truncatus]
MAEAIKKKLSIIKDVRDVSHMKIFMIEFLFLAVLFSQLILPLIYQAYKKPDQVGLDTSQLIDEINKWNTRQTPVSSWRDRDYFINGSSDQKSVIDESQIAEIICFNCSIYEIWRIFVAMLLRLVQHCNLVKSENLKKFGIHRLWIYCLIKTALWCVVVFSSVCSVQFMMELCTNSIHWIDSRVYDATPSLQTQMSSRLPHPFTMGKSPPFYLYKLYRYPMEDVVFKCEYVVPSFKEARPIYKTANWRKNGSPLRIQDDRISVNVSINKKEDYLTNRALYSVMSTLTIQMLEEKDFGLYTCEYYTPLIPVVVPGSSMKEEFTKTTETKTQPMSPDPKCSCKPKQKEPQVDLCTDQVYVPIYQCFAEFNLIKRWEKVIKKSLTPGSILIEGFFYTTVAGLDDMEIEMPKKEENDQEDNCCSPFITTYWRLFRGGGWSSERPPFTRTVITDDGLVFIRYQCMCKSTYGLHDFKIYRHLFNTTTKRKDTAEIVYPVKHTFRPLYTNPWSKAKADNGRENHREENLCLDSGFKSPGCEEMGQFFESSIDMSFWNEVIMIFVVTIISIVVVFILYLILIYRCVHPILSAVLYMNKHLSPYEAVNGVPIKGLRPCRRNTNRRRGRARGEHIEVRENPNYQVYLSYDEENEYDSMVAEHIKGKLLSINVSVFDFQTDVPPGRLALTELEKAIANSSRFVIVASESYEEHKAIEFNAIQTTITGQGSRLKDSLLVVQTEDCGIDRLYSVPCIKVPDYVKEREGLDDASVREFIRWEIETRPVDDAIDTGKTSMIETANQVSYMFSNESDYTKDKGVSSVAGLVDQYTFTSGIVYNNSNLQINVTEPARGQDDRTVVTYDLRESTSAYEDFTDKVDQKEPGLILTSRAEVTISTIETTTVGTDHLKSATETGSNNVLLLADQSLHTQTSTTDSPTLLTDQSLHTQTSTTESPTLLADQSLHTQASTSNSPTILADQSLHTTAVMAYSDGRVHTQTSSADSSTLQEETNSLFDERSVYPPPRSSMLTTSIPRETSGQHKSEDGGLTFPLLHKIYCPFRCLDETLINLNESMEHGQLSLYCRYCKCGQSQCRLYDMCCPDITEPYIPLSDSYDVTKLTPVPYNVTEIVTKFSSVENMLTLSCEKDSGEREVMVIESCPDRGRRVNDSVRELCESDPPLPDITAVTVSQVIDADTNVTYRNVYCALCNNASSPKRSKLKVECGDPMFIYKATSVDEMIRFSMNPGADCNVHHVWEQEYGVFICEANNPRTADTDESNENQNFSGMEQPIIGSGSSSSAGGKLPIKSLISFLLNFNAESYIPVREPLNQVTFHYVNCSVAEWPTPDGHCLPLHCSPGKLLVNSSCAAAFPEIGGLQYRLRLWLIPVHPSARMLQYYPFDSLVQSISEQFESWLSEQNGEFNIRTEMFQPITGSEDDPEDDSLPTWITIDASLRGPADVSRDSFESLAVNYFINNRINVETSRKKLTFQPLQASSKGLTFRSCEVMRRNRSEIDCYSYTTSSWHDPPSDSLRIDPRAIDLSNLLHCAHVIFNQSEYVLSDQGSDLKTNFTLSIDLNVTQVTLSETADLNNVIIGDDGELRVCQEVLERKLKEIQNDVIKFRMKEETEMVRAQSILSSVCIGLSLLCLVLTLLTYGVHPALRTEAGKNNMMLSLSLLLAQVSSLAAAYGQTSGPPCTALGITTHGLWLWMFTWTFICCHHMFRVFTAKIRTASSGNDVKRLVLSALFPASIVSSVVLFSYLQSGGQSIGYSSLSCWFESLVLTVAAFACPLAVVVVCNIGFLIITVVKIHKVRQLSPSDRTKNKENQNNLIVYVKLSAMTGVFWVLAILAEVANNDYFRIISIIISGLEGVYIFLSYVFNQRVLRLYLQKLPPTLAGKVKVTSSTTVSSKADD